MMSRILEDVMQETMKSPYSYQRSSVEQKPVVEKEQYLTSFEAENSSLSAIVVVIRPSHLHIL